MEEPPPSSPGFPACAAAGGTGGRARAGLGLSISYNIARDLNGDFRLEPGEKGGARAVLQLPSGDSDD